MDGKISNFQQLASLRRYTLSEGKEKGVEVIDCDNGSIRFLLNVSKGLDVMQLYHKGQNMSFVSKNGFSAGNTPFSNRFEGGMLYTCGLDSVGGRDGFETHGTYHTTPAQVIRAQCDEDGIVVEALIRNTALFGPNLVMHRTIATAIGSDSVEIEDKLTNLGYKDEQYCILYHTNVGYPMLDEGVTIRLSEKDCCPRNNWAEQNKTTRLSMEAPADDNEETCYFLTLNEPEVSVINPKINKSFTLRYSGETLPYFIEWKSMVSGDYALGLEPCSTLLDDMFTYRTIKKQETVVFRLQMIVTEM